TAEIAAIEEARSQKGGGKNGGAVARRRELPLAQPAEDARRSAQPARQHEMSERKRRTRKGRPDRPGSAVLSPLQRRHEASSTIQLNNSPNECPACKAISGTSDVGVMPGWVLISSHTTSPFSECRSS